MPIETTCQNCAAKLRVSDEHAGKRARCPKCGSIYTIPKSHDSTEAPDSSNPFAQFDVEQSASPYRPSAAISAPAISAPAGGAHLRAHRGGLILVLGVLGWAICAVFGVFAWAMGAADLRAMNRGYMDPSGRGMTMAGMVLGIIQTVMLIGIVAVMAVVLLAGTQ